ncbi:MAG: PAS domain S-box protein [Clostridia bacterium]|nr:PAS domain S-box protein [Clostridia bacterium]
MTKKIFRSIIAVAVTVLIASILIASTFLYEYYNRAQTRQLKEELSLIAASVERVGMEYFDYLDSSIFRFTVVAADGAVLYDSSENITEMENHLDREEIKEAFKSGSGSSSRYSATRTERTIYEAVLLNNGTVLRISVSKITVASLVIVMLPAVCAIIFFAIVLSLFMSDRMARTIVKPLAELDLENPGGEEAYEELVPIIGKLNRQHNQIASQMKELRLKTDELEQITSSMNEGLVLLDRNCTVLSINASAEKLLGTDETAIGRNFLSVDRSDEMKEAVRTALSGKRSEFRKERDGRFYRFIISRTESEGKTVGLVILCLDYTETASAERSRREFTANVSHELKTPLQSIIGSAELLESGLVREEDKGRFIGNIKNEAARLVSLINDIIRLSQLDEESAPAMERVDLADVVSEVADVLRTSAEKKNVTIALEIESCVMNGIRRYLYEIVYNICDNAIRYNKEGGEVRVFLGHEDNNIVLSVSDTGIGIPPEHRERVFERFYRVDKSHSRATGGTGLGLSIVKHAVAYHKGVIILESAVGKGTTIKIIF